jgi:hypothetical protein
MHACEWASTLAHTPHYSSSCRPCRTSPPDSSSWSCSLSCAPAHRHMRTRRVDAHKAGPSSHLDPLFAASLFCSPGVFPCFQPGCRAGWGLVCRPDARACTRLSHRRASPILDHDLLFARWRPHHMVLCLCHPPPRRATALWSLLDAGCTCSQPRVRAHSRAHAHTPTPQDNHLPSTDTPVSMPWSSFLCAAVDLCSVHPCRTSPP